MPPPSTAASHDAHAIGILHNKGGQDAEVARWTLAKSAGLQIGTNKTKVIDALVSFMIVPAMSCLIYTQCSLLSNEIIRGDKRQSLSLQIGDMSCFSACHLPA